MNNKTELAAEAATVGCGLFAILSGVCSAVIPVIIVLYIILRICRSC
jgi:hypothetical protein